MEARGATRVVPVFSSSAEADLPLDDPLLREMAELSTQLMDGTPKLQDVFKNLVSICVARSQLTDDALSIEATLAMVRIILAQLQAHELPEAANWGQLHPQGEDQSGESRINELTRYKVARLLRNRAVANAAKVYKLFGVKYLLWTRCWPAVREACLTARPPSVEEDIFVNLLDTFQAALQLMDDAELKRAEKVDGRDDDEEEVLEAREEVVGLKIASNCDLIFADDFQHALEIRKAARRANRDTAANR